MTRFTVVAGEMEKTIVIKNKFCQLNDKRFYFPDRFVSLPFHHPILSKIDEFKQKRQRIVKYFWEEKEHLISLEKEALKNHPRLYLYHQILMSVPKLFNTTQKYGFIREIKKLFKRNKKDIILEGGWVMK